MEMSITSETVSQNTISGGIGEPIRENKITEITKKVPMVPNKDKEQIEIKSIRKPNYLSEIKEKQK